MNSNLKITNNKLEQEGAWIDWYAVPGIKVKMVRSTTPNIQKHLTLLLKKNRKAMRNDVAQKEVMIQFMSQHVIKGWENIIYDGKPTEYSIENAVTILSDKELFDFYEWVLAASQDVLNFADDENDTSVVERGEELKK